MINTAESLPQVVKNGSIIAQLAQMVKLQISRLKLASKGGDVKNHNLAQILSDESTPIDGDGDDGSPGVQNILIEVALDGYMITFTLYDGTEERYVREDMDGVVSVLRGRS